ncbi:nucleotide exchange factor GrpE [Cellulomonas sp. Leaf395]|uniref:nucleotide exchange factor GrpE n=1 Tax=Cellulomonas sp. Leaf395 TaxID=1736362 RepID=UPI0007003FB1|nr:nucleotide exchange factor GrpE [Cellulomonas sp. Leaf395]KQS98697.1 molecular chaperone GrpE [Cellulomonas sp. Leaf395]
MTTEPGDQDLPDRQEDELTPEEQILADAESIAASAEEEVVLEGLVAVEKLAAERLEELQRSQAAYYNLEQQYSGFVKRSKADALAAHERGVHTIVEALIPVLDDIELARQHGDLTGPFVSIAEKLEGTLGRFGVVRYGEVGETFDPAVHEALMHSHSADVTESTVQMVLQPGYRTPDRVIRAARVAVVDPEA